MVWRINRIFKFAIGLFTKEIERWVMWCDMCVWHQSLSLHRGMTQTKCKSQWLNIMCVFKIGFWEKWKFFILSESLLEELPNINYFTLKSILIKLIPTKLILSRINSIKTKPNTLIIICFHWRRPFKLACKSILYSHLFCSFPSTCNSQ